MLAFFYDWSGLLQGFGLLPIKKFHKSEGKNHFVHEITFCSMGKVELRPQEEGKHCLYRFSLAYEILIFLIDFILAMLPQKVSNLTENIMCICS